jgi:hypothetical protein
VGETERGARDRQTEHNAMELNTNTKMGGERCVRLNITVIQKLIFFKKTNNGKPCQNKELTVSSEFEN